MTSSHLRPSSRLIPWTPLILKFAKVAIYKTTSLSWLMRTNDRWRWYEGMTLCNNKLFATTSNEILLVFDIGANTDIGNNIVTRVELVIKGCMPCSGTIKILAYAKDKEPTTWFTNLIPDLESSLEGGLVYRW